MILESLLRVGDPAPVDITIEDGRIARVERARTDTAPRRVLTGLVDLHTHLREPGTPGETWESGTRAAAAGGYTDVFAMPNTVPCPDTPESYRRIREVRAPSSARVHVVAAATLGRAGEQIVDVAALAAEGARLLSDDGSCVDDADLVEQLLAATAETGTVFAQHAQSRESAAAGVVDDSIAGRVGAVGWPRRGEFEIVRRDIEAARRTGGRLHVCHLSTIESLELVRAAKADGLAVSSEVTPHHLVLHADDAAARGPLLKVNPPLRMPHDTRALRAALRAGHIDIVATDHAPHPAESKLRDWPDAAFGLTGLESALAVVAEVFATPAGVDWAGVQRVMSTEPARIGGLPRAALEPGEPATLVIVDESRPGVIDPARHMSASANSPFAGRPTTIGVVLTMIDGRVTFERQDP